MHRWICRHLIERLSTAMPPVRAADTYGAAEFAPGDNLHCFQVESQAGQLPTTEVGPGQAVAIATGAMIPRGGPMLWSWWKIGPHGKGDQLLLQRKR